VGSVKEHTRTHIDLEWFGLLKCNTLRSFFCIASVRSWSTKLKAWGSYSVCELPGRAWVVLGLNKLKEACAREGARKPKHRYCMNELSSQCLKQIKSMNCLARRETMPFCSSRGSIYNVWFTGTSTLYFQTKLTLQGSQATCIIRLSCPKEHKYVLALRRSPRGPGVRTPATWGA
jgi:hypothetical protein